MRLGSKGFKQWWHQRELEVDGRLLTWIFIDDPRAAPHAEAFRWRDGEGLHHDTARQILTEHGHPDASHVPSDRVRGGRFH